LAVRVRCTVLGSSFVTPTGVAQPIKKTIPINKTVTGVKLRAFCFDATIFMGLSIPEDE
jgi:hypothetical protein